MNSEDINTEISLVRLSWQMAGLLVLPILACMGLGLGIDLLLGGGFFFLILGAIFGIGIASVLAVRKVTAVMRLAEEDYQKTLKEKALRETSPLKGPPKDGDTSDEI